ncbi:hypothetical protein [Acetobacter musti]|nr:hypothetical protein [Acetobacter musti]
MTGSLRIMTRRDMRETRSASGFSSVPEALEGAFYVFHAGE